MHKFAWLTDVHFNFCEGALIEKFLAELCQGEADCLLLGGDIGEAPSVVDYLRRIDAVFDGPIYFVLGNHDFYRGSIGEVRRDVANLCQERTNLIYLSTVNEPVELAPGVGLVGHDGWADGRVGDYDRSEVMLNDYRLIAEFSSCGKTQRLPIMRSLAAAAAEHVRLLLPRALSKFEHVYLLTHVPPLREACWYQGHMSDDEWAPHFICLSVGEAILEIMAEHSNRRLTVLCGHSHTANEHHESDNVEFLTGAAEYGKPEVQRIFVS